MNSLPFNHFLKNWLRFLCMLLIISFIFDVGFKVFRPEPFMPLLQEWFNQLFTPTSLLIKLFVSVVFAAWQTYKQKNA